MNNQSELVNQVCVIQFAKTPRLGKVKTRMQPHLSEQQSCDLHAALTVHTLGRLNNGVWDYRLYWAGENDAHWRESLSLQAQCFHRQAGECLGERMAQAFAETLPNYKFVVLVGSDCPFLESVHIEGSIAALKQGSDVCLIPAHDGGYVAIALKNPSPELFVGVDWGSDRVLNQTLAQAAELKVSTHLLPALSDVDRPEDLPLLKDFEWAAPILRSVETGVDRLSSEV
jgi:rSAM/selenodomain-associated transferase 1